MRRGFLKWLAGLFQLKDGLAPAPLIVAWILFFIAIGFILTGGISYLTPEEIRGAAFRVFSLSGMAALVAGFFVGFLFGIPRVLQGAIGDGVPKVSDRYEQRVNTNLEQISDWLTKILVGVGLVELKDAPAFIWKISKHLSQSFSIQGTTNSAVVPAICASLVFYATLGVLFGYLVTRLYFASAFSAADRGTVQSGILDAAQVPQDQPAPVEGDAYAPTSSAKRILATLNKYQKEYVQDENARWTFSVSPASPNYPDYIKGLSELLENGLVVVSPETNQAMLSAKGLKYCKDPAHDLSDVEIYKF